MRACVRVCISTGVCACTCARVYISTGVCACACVRACVYFLQVCVRVYFYRCVGGACVRVW